MESVEEVMRETKVETVNEYNKYETKSERFVVDAKTTNS